MKIIDRIILTIFSIVILIESVISIFLIFGWVDIQNIILIVKDVLNNNVIYNTVFAISILFILLSLKAILFSSSSSKNNNEIKKQEKTRDGVLLENEDGKLLISRETIERIANNVVNNYSNIQDAKTKVLIDENNYIAIVVEAQILQNTVIKDLNTNLQSKIKDAVKDATDLEVNEVNIKIKNIIPVQENKIEEEE